MSLLPLLAMLTPTAWVIIAIGGIVALVCGSQLIFLLQRVVIALAQIGLFVAAIVGAVMIWSWVQQENETPAAPASQPSSAQLPPLNPADRQGELWP